MIQNPILRGFNPDPSIVKVEKDFYIATSTFEWFPGVQIHHSTDLHNWSLVSRPLEKLSQLNMAGNPSSGGIWAPCLSYSDGLFHLIYTDVKSWKSGVRNEHGFKDSHNYLVTAPSIEGPWSDPIYLNSSGFDPSLFHDDDGKKWFVNMQWDHRPGENPFSGILLQEYSPQEKRLVGEIKNIFLGTDIASTEGPHLYKKDDYYYLLVAEGGTVYQHAATMARSKNIDGPYETDPNYPLLTTKLNAEEQSKIDTYMLTRNTHTPISLTEKFYSRLHKAGHASLCHVQGEEWALAHLCGRPLKGTARCILGRETSIQKVIWKKDQWPYLDTNNGTKAEPITQVQFSAPYNKAKTPVNALINIEENFTNNTINKAFQSLRIPLTEKMAIKNNTLELKGGESPVSCFRQTVLALRISHKKFLAQTCVEYLPTTFQHFAGLILRYDEENFFYVILTYDNRIKSTAICLMKNNNGELSITDSIAYTNKQVHFKVESGINNDMSLAQFYYSSDQQNWKPLSDIENISILSDEYATPLGFTGAFVGMSSTDITGMQLPAYFSHFTYKEFSDNE